jgi:hypothetical protein
MNKAAVISIFPGNSETFAQRRSRFGAAAARFVGFHKLV